MKHYSPLEIINGSTPAASPVGVKLFSDTNNILKYIVPNGTVKSIVVSPLQIDGFHEAPTNQTITLRHKAKFAGRIDNISIATSSGTIVATVQINGVTVTGLSSISVSSTNTDANSSGSNTFAIGDKITLVLSSNAGATNLAWSIQITQL